MNALLPRLVNSATFLFFALSLAVKSGYSYGTALLLLAALITLPQWWPRRPHDAALRWLAFGFLFAGSVALLDVIRSGLGARGLEAPLKFFAVPLLLYFLATVPPKGRAIWAGAACGALLGLASAWYYSHFAPELLPAGRAARYLHPIQLGNIAMLLALIAACSLRARPRHWQLLLTLAGIVAGVCTTLLSQTRGSFFALAWTLFFLGLLSLRRRHFRARSVALSATIVAITAALFWLGNMDVIEERLAAARHDIALYEQGKADTSIGARFEMWRFAWQEGSSYPLIGPGTAQLNVDKDGWGGGGGGGRGGGGGGEVLFIVGDGFGQVFLSAGTKVVALRVRADENGEPHLRHELTQPRVPGGGKFFARRFVPMFAFTRIVEVHGGKREKVRVVELVISNTQPLPQQPPAGVIPGFVGLLRNPAGCLPHQHNACCCGSGVHRRVPFGAHLSVRCGVVDFLV